MVKALVLIDLYLHTSFSLLPNLLFYILVEVEEENLVWSSLPLGLPNINLMLYAFQRSRKLGIKNH